MADGPGLGLQAAMIAALRANGAVTALVAGRVYDEPPKGVTLPYVRLGNLEVSPNRTDGCVAWDVRFSFEAHSRPRQGRVEARRIGEAIIAALDEQEASLAVQGFEVSWLFFLTEATVRKPDGETYQSNCAFEALLDPA